VTREAALVEALEAVSGEQEVAEIREVAQMPEAAADSRMAAPGQAAFRREDEL
jgi:hypothetical protein